ncbi:hypothetical protein TraAM80_09365 [Trypanosoma rangeli]|uniref:Uncharacterized protein n=1 Tax=Trypanosoma rangeli TaxID=5698 RepID=A0A3R7JV98_TRYRA|nr:uncharacterized protein TraAM80_09365 [Trypanosoma rangeli]RNE97378.1 hypothetical protein TraAM80_09365 [Trypanosoma rangeli]|eukprot:RNE97378.1 hypothetical protein TraAM80_09365 [Trypanosoma rangeli]
MGNVQHTAPTSQKGTTSAVRCTGETTRRAIPLDKKGKTLLLLWRLLHCLPGSLPGRLLRHGLLRRRLLGGRFLCRWLLGGWLLGGWLLGSWLLGYLLLSGLIGIFF